jgi:hypothetical protein
MNSSAVAQAQAKVNFMLARVKAARGNPKKVFDWKKAAEIIKENNIQNAFAGLDEDWSATSDVILSEGKPVKGYCYLQSSWATPVLIADGDHHECWVENHPEWDVDTIWPDEALQIIGLQIEDDQ